ncbi:hypothetical protein [Aliikangiella coralliicola]|uniref:Uncharacterized protein n=1 Tax=Aliikangiella coralliicola TaxID=2592383 RepID=A0A545UFP5_9GAMM|nr:hypothetical protein [Aliikangiella coralliicola]TQV88290.1 hypothetical protein FLL46_07110 [Aliikangiella coralliicola]
MSIYHLEISSEACGAKLFPLKDGRYQKITNGSLEPVLVGVKYILIKKEIAEYLKSLDIDRISFKPVIIYDRTDESENSSYEQMIVNHHFHTTEFNDVDTSGKQFLLFNYEYLFVTSELKDILDKSKFDFEFSYGFSNFC